MPWYICDVDRAGTSESADIAISLTEQNGAFAGWYVVTDEKKKNEILATALTAISNYKSVEVGMGDTNEITAMYLIK